MSSLGRAAALVIWLVFAAVTPLSQGAALTSGQLYGFGNNDYGELGSMANSGPRPRPVVLPGERGGVADAAAGAHSLVVTASGQLYSFGDNEYGELGRWTAGIGTIAPNPTPTIVSLPGQRGPVTKVAAGDYHSLVLTASGQLYAFGLSNLVELGTTVDGPDPRPRVVSLPGATGRVTQIAAGYGHSLALTGTGQLYAFGVDGYGQLGFKARGGVSTPRLVTLPGERGPVTQIAAGDTHSLALTATGQLYAFGQNTYGQLGIPTNSGTIEPTPTPTRVSLPGENGSVLQIAAGDDHSLVLTASGQLYAFGQNFNGQLGNSINAATTNPNPTPTLVSLPSANGPVTGMGVGRAFSLAMTASGQLYAFGNNFFGQLGASDVGAGLNPTPLRAALPAGLLATKVASGLDDDTLVVLATTPSPVLSQLRATPSTFPLTGRRQHGRCVKGTPKNRTHKRCTRPIRIRITYTLSRRAILVFTTTGWALGRAVKGRCVRPTRMNRARKACERPIVVPGSISRPSGAGPHNVTFDGHIGTTTLGPGSYLLTATPTAQGQTGPPQTVLFTVTT